MRTVRGRIAAGVRAHTARSTPIALAAFGLFVAGRDGVPMTATAGLIPAQYRRAARSQAKPYRIAAAEIAAQLSR